MYARFVGLGLLCGLLLGVSPAAIADEEFARKGMYVGVGGVFAIEKFGGGTEGPYAGGFNVTLGYRASEVISVESEYEWVGRWDKADDAGGETKINMWSWSANVKGNVPIGRLSPYGLIGFGLYRGLQNPGSDDDFDAMMKAGAGVDIYITKNVVFSPEWAYDFLFNSTQSFDYMGVSGKITYRF